MDNGFSNSISHEATPGSVSDNVASHPQATLLFESIVSDVQWSAFNIATLTCLLNANLQQNAQWTLRPWRHLLHDNTHIMQLGLRFGNQIGISELVVANIDKMYAVFSDAKRSLSPIANGTECYDNHRQQLRSIANDWTILSQAAVELLISLEHETTHRLSELHNCNAQLIKSFLREAVAGSTGRVNSWGEITLPELTQRRRAPRVATMQKCRIVSQGTATSATLRDISIRGVGLACDRKFSEKQQIVVEFANERRLKAVVIWQKDDRIGAELIEPLSISDPLLVRN